MESWIKIDLEKLPSDMRIFEWKHPDYGIIEGSIIPGGIRTNVSLWILPSDGRSAEIWLNEFTHYRKITRH